METSPPLLLQGKHATSSPQLAGACAIVTLIDLIPHH
jgi:hypothetical protein